MAVIVPAMFTLLFYKLLFGLAVIISNSTANRTLHRDKRYLIIYPRGGSFKIVIGFAVPVKLGSKQQMAIGWNLQFQYAVTTNISQIQNYPPIVSRQAREVREELPSDRKMAYLGFEQMLNGYGLNGRECLLRSICENALETAYHDVNGLYGQLLHIALTPDYGDGEIEPDLDPVYLEAQRAGEFGIDCQSLYTNCNYEGNGLLDIISILQD